MRVLSFTLLIAFAQSAAALTCTSFVRGHSESLVYENQNRIVYTKTEVFNQNNRVGIQQMGTLTFEVWHELSFEFDQSGDQVSIIGLTKEGTVYHLIKSGDRTIARKLSGEKKFERLQVTDKGLILGQKVNGVIELFSPKIWSEPASKKALRYFKKLWALSASLGIAGAQFFPELNMPVDLKFFSFNFPMYEMVLTVAGGLSAGFPALLKLDVLNRYPDGFAKTDLDFNDAYWFKKVNRTENNLEHFNLPEFKYLAPKLEEQFTQEIE